jgi:aspartate/methionine/tyrosine aminotransferase
MMRGSRRGEVDPFIVMDVMEDARRLEAQGVPVIHMEVGQPGTLAPLVARQAVRAALDQPLGYTVALGLPALREGIARLYQTRHGVTLDPARVIVTAGSSAAFLLAFSAFFEASDKVGLGEPGYPSYRQILRALSLQPFGIPTSAEARYQPQVADLTDDLAGLIVASPSNPCGTMLSLDELRSLADWASGSGKVLISDEIYHGLTYESPAHSALEVSDDVVVINSFSKYWSMTGWRIGWMVVPEAHVRRIERLAQNMFICPPHVAQVAALAALAAEDEAQANLAVYSENRRLLLDGLPKAGFTRLSPADGAFYLYADLEGITSDSLAFCREILERAHVAVTPGLDFDPHRGHATLRFSYARATPDIAEGLARLTRFMASR